MKMKSRSFVAILILLTILYSCSEQQAQKQAQPNTQKQVMTIDTLDYENFNAQQKSDFDSMHDAWLNDHFFVIRNQLGLKQDCKVCGDLTFDVQIETDQKGIVQSIQKILVNIDCSGTDAAVKKQFETEITGKINSLHFPASLAGKVIRCRLGKVTRC